ncbi:SAG-related sequence SRS49B [Toxoplasma gondii RUB]|uniref:SAG-related sequence SRS49B n=1 Tax=Toxoplasma gondii RUB TaxID=935652 RepID=A0A086LKM7_TOXGO|nr:SAG-related sequence SRS49B [Toxoplasma gondii RUB]
MATAHSTVANRYSTFRPALFQGIRSDHSPFSVLRSCRCLPLYLFVLFACNFVQHSHGDSVPQQPVPTCSPSASPLSLNLTTTKNVVKFKCGEGLELHKKPTEDGKLCGNTACTKEIDASAFTFTPQSQRPKNNSTPDTEYSLGVKGNLPTTPLTVYFSCDPKSAAGSRGSAPVEASESNKPCVVQVSVFSQNPTPVPDANKCKDGQVALAITSTTKSVTFGCNGSATLEPRLFEHVFIEEQSQSGHAAATPEEKQVVLQALVPSSSLVENAADTTPTTVGYTLSCPNLPSSAQAFFYKCVPPKLPSGGGGRTGTPQGCKVLISVEKRPDSDATATPAPSGSEQGIVLSSSFMIVSISLVTTATGKLF